MAPLLIPARSRVQVDCGCGWPSVGYWRLLMQSTLTGKSFWISIVQKEGGLILYFDSRVNRICSQAIEFIHACYKFSGTS